VASRRFLVKNHYDIQPCARAALTAVPRSTQPSTLCGMENEYQLAGRIITINDDGGCGFWQATGSLRGDSQPGSVGLG